MCKSALCQANDSEFATFSLLTLRSTMSAYEQWAKIQNDARRDAHRAPPGPPLCRPRKAAAPGRPAVSRVRKGTRQRALDEAARRGVFSDAVDAAKKAMPVRYAPYGFKNHNELASAMKRRIADLAAESDELDAVLAAERARRQQQPATWTPMTAMEVTDVLLDFAVPADLLAAADEATTALLHHVPAWPPSSGPGKRPSMRARPQLMDIPVADVVAEALAEIERVVPGDFLDAMGVDTPRKSRKQRPLVGAGGRLCFD